MKRYNPKDIEPKWQKQWAESKIYEAQDSGAKPKKYILEYFPYPSGAAMHVGHVRNYVIGDAMTRHARMRGYNVLHPMGWDAFGLPAENYAIKTGISPQQTIKESTAKFKQQLTQMGFGYDWSREFSSSDPAYYKWTQWFFQLLYKRGLAYRKESLQWWCPVDKTVLANEQVENGQCWRCGSVVEKKALPQWFFKITDYADRLDKDLDDVNWTDSIKSMQRNWIGKSRGAEIDFAVDGSDQKIKVFTTRPDTIYGATFMVLAPEHPLVKEITTAEQRDEVNSYIKQAQAKSDIERQETEREKTGVFTGAYAVNPPNGENIPIWIADYVLYGYGTGAIMAVPAHDERDWAFAKKFDLPIVPVYDQEGADPESCYHGEGTVKNSGSYDGIRTEGMREKIVADLEKQGVGKERVNYKIRDWLISRQRYWGAPIPMVHCERCGIVPVPEDQLPVELPVMESYEPSGDGRSPLARAEEWVNTTCPQCGGPAQRETDTMDGFACSSWYFLRFADPHNSEKPFDTKHVKYWLPVDDYIGGAEHAVMHLLYARFWTKVMYDDGLIDFQEPFTTLRNQGMILAPDGQKMSKSKGNTIEPDGLIQQGYGADAIRIMELFIGPWNQQANWSVEGMGGAHRFLQRVWTLVQDYLQAAQNTEAADPQADDHEFKQLMHRTIHRVSKDIEEMGFNTAIAALMEAINDLYKLKTKTPFAKSPQAWQWTIETLLQLLAPFAPHITEELWQQLGKSGSIHQSDWPVHDEKYLVRDRVTIVVQVNGKVRTQLDMPAGTTEAQAVEAAKADPKAAAHVAGKDIKKTVYVPGKLVNFVV
jgi:leucyl-tRNA synthetase